MANNFLHLNESISIYLLDMIVLKKENSILVFHVVLFYCVMFGFMIVLCCALGCTRCWRNVLTKKINSKSK